MPNKYSYLILQVTPLQKSIYDKFDTKQYAFLMRKTERAHQGQEPTQTKVAAERVLKKLERRLQKLLKKAEKNPEKAWYRNNFSDAVRYHFMGRYDYIEHYCGKEKFFWDILFMILAVVLCLLIIAIGYVIFN